ncbi:S1/P1 nuclease [Taibaiella chishuiensis]|uniref:S1/P1 nuclease n=1 Tax=Taibaiella chishuiensis TaxID=1434707 RepID=A0A2P8D1A3_9BACT|nr:S1/P1 nuclease [Taibaiella chishuiensis]PSK91010.1 S1/P1 nuclease [Taibaiella chishuiensis]
MKRNITKLLLLFLLLATAQTGFGWGVTGHRVVAEIAQRHLSGRAKRELRQLIGDQQLAFWVNWPDFIKSDTTGRWKAMGQWHYVDLPGQLSKADFVQQLKEKKGENLYTQIKAMAAQLADKKLPLEQRQIALRFLIHLAGDLGQPLHVGRSDDQGGNKITVYWFDKKTNLHALWDEALIDFQQWSYTEYATVLDVAGKDQVAAWQRTPLEDCFYESHVLSDKIYALSPPDAKLSYRYNYLFAQDLNDQLLKSGIRLAALLNDALGR